MEELGNLYKTDIAELTNELNSEKDPNKRKQLERKINNIVKKISNNRDSALKQSVLEKAIKFGYSDDNKKSSSSKSQKSQKSQKSSQSSISSQSSAKSSISLPSSKSSKNSESSSPKFDIPKGLSYTDLAKELSKEPDTLDILSQKYLESDPNKNKKIFKRRK